jgi:hypothetical protein
LLGPRYNGLWDKFSAAVSGLLAATALPLTLIHPSV